MKIYLIGSLRNPNIVQVGNRLRAAGYDVFDQWWAPGRETDSFWQEYTKARGQTYREAIQDHYAKHVYDFDKCHLDAADAAVLVLPAGKSAHLEAGYVCGRSKPMIVMFDGEPERYDIMYQFASAFVFSEDELLEEFKKFK